MAKTYSISELASEFDITTRTIRFYEEKGMLGPDRNGTTRVYQAADRTKLKLILRGKRLGFTLEESQSIIDMYNPSRSNQDQLETLLQTIKQKKQQLAEQIKDIEMMMSDLNDSEKNCIKELKTSHDLKRA